MDASSPSDIPSVFIPGTPGALDFEGLSDSMRRSLDLLAPIIEIRHSTAIGSDISTQAIKYIRAIKQGSKAVRRGFVLSTDILGLTDHLDSSSPEERAGYLSQTRRIAGLVSDDVKVVFDGFRNFRREIYDLIEKYKSIRGLTLNPTAELTQGINLLENFVEHASILAQWWDWIMQETEAARRGQATIASDVSSIRLLAAEGRWKRLRTQFADYTHLVDQLEDVYPDLLQGALDLPPHDSGELLQRRPAFGHRSVHSSYEQLEFAKCCACLIM